MRQAYLAWRRRPYTHPPFQVKGFYRYVRHPLMLGLFLAFWVTPSMTVGRLLCVTALTVYILIGTHFEERSLDAALGSDYAQYRARVPKFFPRGLRPVHAHHGEVERS